MYERVNTRKGIYLVHKFFKELMLKIQIFQSS